MNNLFSAVRVDKLPAVVLISATDEKVALTLLRAYISKRKERLIPQIVKMNTIYIQKPTVKDEEMKTWIIDYICNTDEKVGVLYTIGQIE